jgi:hypothetical protein
MPVLIRYYNWPYIPKSQNFRRDTGCKLDAGQVVWWAANKDER